MISEIDVFIISGFIIMFLGSIFFVTIFIFLKLHEVQQTLSHNNKIMIEWIVLVNKIQKKVI